MATPDNNTGLEWDNDIKTAAIKYCDTAICYRELHSQNNMNIYEFILDIRNIDLFSDCINTIIFIILGTTSCENQTVLILIASIINMINIIITTYIKVKSNRDISAGDKISCKSWNRLIRDIKVGLATTIDITEQRVSLRIWTNEFNRIIETSPNINKNALNKFNKLMNKIYNNDSDKNELFQYLQLKFKINNKLTRSGNITPYKEFMEEEYNSLIKINSDEDVDETDVSEL